MIAIRETHFTKNICRFLTPKIKTGTDMINPSIESSDFLFWQEKQFGVRFLKILWETDKVHFTSSNLVCVYTHPKFQNMKFSLYVFDKIFKIPTPNFLYAKNRKSELSIDGLIISAIFNSRCEKAAKVFL